jgi:hypothetical protein
MDDPVRELLTEHLPAPPPDLTEPPLAAIRRRARRRTGTQMAAAVAAVAVVATGTAFLVTDDGTADNSATPGPSLTDSATRTSPSTGMLFPTYLPSGYREESSGDSVLRYLNPAADPPIPLVVRKLSEDARIPAEGPSLASPTVRGRTAEVLPIANGGMTLTWLENGSRFSVSFEAPPDTQIDFALEQTVDKLVAVADGLRPAR